MKYSALIFMMVTTFLNSWRVNAENFGITSPGATFDVGKYGAKANGRTDCSKAFLGAWQAACSSTQPSTMIVPKGNFLVNPVIFRGPCKSNKIKVQINGRLIAPTKKSLYKDVSWLHFRDTDGLTVNGDGVLDGQGASWWPKTCEGTGNVCNDAPTALRFSKVKDLTVTGITSTNSMQTHMVLFSCNNSMIDGVKIQAPSESPNTDGIKIATSSNVTIRNAIISTGDDCVAIIRETSNLLVQGGSCGPGHGISIGSLGKDGAEEFVNKITVDGVSFHDTDNGVRIKTWQGGKGFATGFKFQNLIMGKNVKTPIIIDQSYCPRCSSVEEKPSAVKISDVLLKNIKGTSSRDVAIKFECSKSIPCEGIKLEDIQLSYNGQAAKCLANNAKITETGVVSPPCLG